MTDNKNQDKLRLLQKKYISQLPDKIKALNKQWLITQRNRSNESFSALIQLTHNLAGSAGTFGFPGISTQARSLEIKLRALSLVEELSSENKTSVTDALSSMERLVKIGPDVDQHAVDYSKPVSRVSEVSKLIYIIDDDELLVSEISAQLKYFDYKAKAFHNLADASKAVKTLLPSAMIIDLQLPEGDLAGTDFGKQFYEFSSVQVPIVYISARDDWDARLSAVRANAAAYLTKPLDFNELLEKLDAVTQKIKPVPYRIMIIDDMAVLAEHYALVLKSTGMEVKVISDVSDMLEVLSDFQPELIIMDIYMPQCSGLEAAAIIRQKSELLSVPIVFLSTEGDPLKHHTAMELGGDDFLQKPINDDRLVAAVRTRAQRFRNLRSHMHKDGLTGLLNHVTIKTQLESEISRAQRQSEPLTFAMIDIDHFKRVNDTYGHPVGDRVIKSISRMLVKRLRKSDIIGRYGGEEFAIILPGTELKVAEELLNDIRVIFSKIPQQTNEVQFNCTLSAGLSQLTSSCSADELMRRADEALYEAKESGRNKVCTS